MLILWPNYVVYVTLTYINYGSGSYTGFCRIDDPDIQASETTVGIGVYRGRYSCRTAYHVNPDGYRQRKYSDLGRYRGGIPVVCFGIGIQF